MVSKTMKAKAIELFCGIGGFRVACDRAGLTTVFANDIDEPACDVYEDNFGTDVLVRGDINNHLSSIPSHDVLTAGFPCQPFSAAGKKRGIEDIRGTLFESIASVVSAHKPKFFVLENVKRLLEMDGGRHFYTILNTFTELGYTVEWCVLDASGFSLPQSRERIFIVGSRDSRTHSIFHSSKSFGGEFQSYYGTAKAWEPAASVKKFHKWGVAVGDKCLMATLPAPRLSAEPKALHNFLEEEVDEKYFFTEDTRERIKKSVAVGKYINGVEILFNQKGGARMGYTVFGVNGVAPTLTCATSRHYERYQVGDGYRRLTPTEYARIQGFGDEHCRVASHRLRYVLYGNAVPPPMAEWVLKRTLSSGDGIPLDVLFDRQGELFG